MHASIRFFLGSFSIAAFLTQAAAALGRGGAGDHRRSHAGAVSVEFGRLCEGKFRCLGIRYQRLPECLGGARRSRAADHSVHFG